MATNSSTRLGTAPEEGVKSPVKVATTSPITLSGLQTIDGYSVQSGDRVLVKNQTDKTENGIYDAKVGAWTRAKDWNRADDVVDGVLVLDTNTRTLYQAQFSGDFNVGTTKVNFILGILNTIGMYPPIYQTATAGQTIVELGQELVTALTVFSNGVIQYPTSWEIIDSPTVEGDKALQFQSPRDAGEELFIVFTNITLSIPNGSGSGRLVNVVDYGASVNSSASTNLTAFRNAMTAASESGGVFYVPDAQGTFQINGYVLIPPTVKQIIIDGHISMEGELPAGFYVEPETNLRRRGLFVAGVTTKTLLGSFTEDKSRGDRNFNLGTTNPDLVPGDVLLIRDVNDYTFGNFRNVTDGSGNVIWNESTTNSDRPYYHASELSVVRVISQTAGFEGDVFPYKFLRDDYTAADTEIYKLEMSEIHISGSGKITGINDTSPSPINPAPSPVNREVVPAFLIDQCTGSMRDITVEKCSQMNVILNSCVGFKVHNSTVQQFTYSTPADNLHYGIQVSGCEDVIISDSFISAMKHAVAIGGSDPMASVNRDVIVHNCVLKSNYSYAADLHGNTEFCVYHDNTIIGGMVFSGTNNASRNNIISPNYDGVAYYVSELVTTEHVIDGDTLVDVGANASSHGVISIGGNSVRGITAAMREGGTFIIRNLKVKWNKQITGICDITNLNSDQAACEAAGGTFVPEDVLLGTPSYCVIDRPTDQLTCEAAPFNGTWNTGGYNLLAIRNRGYAGDDVEFIISNISFDTDASYNYTYVDNLPDNEGRGWYQGIEGVPIKSITVDTANINKGGFSIRSVKNVILKNVRVRNAARRGIELRDIEDYLELNDVEVFGSGNSGIIHNNDLRDQTTERLAKAVLINVRSYDNNKLGIASPSRDADAAISLRHIDTVIYRDNYGSINSPDAIKPNNVAVSIRFCNTLWFEGNNRSEFKGVEEGFTFTNMDQIYMSNNMNAVESSGVFEGYRGVIHNVDTSGGAASMDLRVLSGSETKGDRLKIRDITGSFSTNNLTLIGNGKTINGSATQVLSDAGYNQWELYYDGTEWKLFKV